VVIKYNHDSFPCLAQPEGTAGLCEEGVKRRTEEGQNWSAGISQAVPYK